MKSRKIIYSNKAQADLFEIELWLESQTGKGHARSYVDRLVDKCSKLDLAAHRGTSHDNIFPRLRTIGFERRVTIAFTVSDECVDVLRIFRAGRNWEADFSED